MGLSCYQCVIAIVKRCMKHTERGWDADNYTLSRELFGNGDLVTRCT